ncbi:hypothetical protein GCM10011514_36590 [Emticicia aquatilis]|uniref:Uncharacterized protein n=1 Tax=Emticicia aquatilis TaxID=1537369 RepID=A0A917DTD1_9BACT|nr:hypothetical protein [Emticicia aquatilis]GGD69121.1 hypothetical protein GCM10011514_36590 [Emticicia aquatilis]
MKKLSVLVVLFVLGLSFNTFAQTNFFEAKWEITVAGTPNGDAKFVTKLERKDGKLGGELSLPADASAPKIPITNIEESADKIIIFFSAQGYDVNVELTKVDDNNLKGTLMNMFEAKAIRVKE